MGRSASLASRINEREKEAERKEIHYKARLVAEYLGTRSSLNLDGTGRIDGYQHTFTSKGLSIVYRDGTQSGNDGDMPISSVVINTPTGIVFEAHLFGGVTGYAPGPWERKLDRLAINASKVRLAHATSKMKEERKTKQRETEETRRKWGL